MLAVCVCSDPLNLPVFSLCSSAHHLTPHVFLFFSSSSTLNADYSRCSFSPSWISQLALIFRLIRGVSSPILFHLLKPLLFPFFFLPYSLPHPYISLATHTSWIFLHVLISRLMPGVPYPILSHLLKPLLLPFFFLPHSLPQPYLLASTHNLEFSTCFNIQANSRCSLSLILSLFLFFFLSY